MRKPILFSWSGGKDSALALRSLLQDPEFEVVGLLTTVTEGFDRISMHGVRRELLQQQAESIGLPVEEVSIPPNCDNQTYEVRMAATMQQFRQRGTFHVAFGDIFLEDLRTYRESKLRTVHMTAVFPIWKVDSRELVARFLSEQFRAIAVCIDPKRLHAAFAGRELDASFFYDLPANVDPCGENEEFHSFVFAGPIFRSPIPVLVGPVVERDSYVFCDLRSAPAASAPLRKAPAAADPPPLL